MNRRRGYTVWQSFGTGNLMRVVTPLLGLLVAALLSTPVSAQMVKECRPAIPDVTAGEEDQLPWRAVDGHPSIFAAIVYCNVHPDGGYVWFPFYKNGVNPKVS